MKNVVDNVIRNAFRNLIEMEQEDGNIKLIYPTLRDGKGKRHSEQEFKQLFIDNFCKATTDLKYSVETPTPQKCSHKGKQLVIGGKEGRSGNIDLCIHQKVDGEWKLLHLVEFKAHNVPRPNIEKDLLKLSAPFSDDKLNKTNYFIQLIYPADKETVKSLNSKYDELKSLFEKSSRKQIVVYILFVNGIKGQHDNALGYYSFDLLESLDTNNYKTIMP